MGGWGWGKQIVTVPGNNYFNFLIKYQHHTIKEKKIFLTSCKSSFWNEEGPNNNCNCCSKFKEPESKTKNNNFLLINIHSTSSFMYEIFEELFLKNSYTLCDYSILSEDILKTRSEEYHVNYFRTVLIHYDKMRILVSFHRFILHIHQ